MMLEIFLLFVEIYEMAFLFAGFPCVASVMTTACSSTLHKDRMSNRALILDLSRAW